MHLLVSCQSSVILCCSSCLHVNHQWFYVVHLVYNAIQIFNPNCSYIFRVSKSLRIHGIKQKLCQIFVKYFYQSYVNVLLFCCCSLNAKKLCFVRYLSTPSFLYIAFITNAKSLAFLFLIRLATLYLDATLTPYNHFDMHLYVFYSNTLSGT